MKNDAEVANDDERDCQWTFTSLNGGTTLALTELRSQFSYKISILKAFFLDFELQPMKILYPLEKAGWEKTGVVFVWFTESNIFILATRKQAEMMHLTRKGLLKLEYRAVDRKRLKRRSWLSES